MRQPATFDIFADRWVPFDERHAFVDLDFTGATVAGQVRLTRDASGSALASFTTSITYAGTATVSAHIAAGRLRGVPGSHALTDTVFVSVIRLQIAEATMEAMPYPAERGDDMTLYYDVQITPSGGTKDVWERGKFIVRAGVTP